MLSNKKKQVLTLLCVLAIPTILIGIWWWVPKWQISSIKFSSPDKQAEMENAYRTTLIQTLGGIFFFVTAYFSYRNLKATEDRQITERYSKSIEQLGDDRIEVQLGGIFALERIAKDSCKDHWTAMEVLTSFVQGKSPLLQGENPQKITKNVQAALTVIGWRDFSKDPEYVRLDLRANLSEADLRGAYLKRAYLFGARLRGAFLRGADLRGANLSEADLRGAYLSEADLRGAFLRGADLRGAFLSKADLREVQDLTLEQVRSAREGWEQAIYDPDFCKELRLPAEPTIEDEDI